MGGITMKSAELNGTEETELMKYVTEFMLDMGVPAHLKGYHYLRVAILMAEEDMEVGGGGNQMFYPSILKKL